MGPTRSATLSRAARRSWADNGDQARPPGLHGWRPSGSEPRRETTRIIAAPTPFPMNGRTTPGLHHPPSTDRVSSFAPVGGAGHREAVPNPVVIGRAPSAPWERPGR